MATHRETTRVKGLMPTRGRAWRALTDEERSRWMELAAVTNPPPRILGPPSGRVLLQESINRHESAIFGLVRRHFEAAFLQPSAAAARVLRKELGRYSAREHLSLRCSDRIPELVWNLPADGWRLVDTSIDYVFRAAPAGFDPEGAIVVPRGAERREAAALLGRLLTDRGAIRTRFTTDPQLRAGAPRLYAEWAQRGLRPGAGRFALVARGPRGRILGCMTAGLAGEGVLAGRARIELNAVHPSARSRGLYSALLATMLRRLFAAGAREVRVRTSGGTTGVQRAWQRCGGAPVRVDVVFHRPSWDGPGG